MPEYRVGDIVRVTRTGRINGVSDAYLDLADVVSERSALLDIRTPGSLRIEMVRKSPEMHNGPKPPAGTVIRGKDLKRIWWKRGTIVRCVASESGLPITGYTGMVLRADGLWHTLDNDNAWSQTYKFEELADGARFELRFVA